MHCKKIRLAVEDALQEYPSPLENIDHKWVAGGWRPLTFFHTYDMMMLSLVTRVAEGDWFAPVSADIPGWSH